jgi:hypothetical protein
LQRDVVADMPAIFSTSVLPDFDTAQKYAGLNSASRKTFGENTERSFPVSLRVVVADIWLRMAIQ